MDLTAASEKVYYFSQDEVQGELKSERGFVCVPNLANPPAAEKIGPHHVYEIAPGSPPCTHFLAGSIRILREVPPNEWPESVATTDPDGVTRWRSLGMLHRTDGPAVIMPDGSTSYYACGILHREDGPAVIKPDGCREYWVRGKRHRIGGPAVETPTGICEYWENGVRVKTGYRCYLLVDANYRQGEYRFVPGRLYAKIFVPLFHGLLGISVPVRPDMRLLEVVMLGAVHPDGGEVNGGELFVRREIPADEWASRFHPREVPGLTERRVDGVLHCTDGPAVTFQGKGEEYWEGGVCVGKATEHAW